MTNNKELEPIAKQVSLLNRLIELLMARNSENIRRVGSKLEKDELIELHREWSDELVKVANELKNLKGIHEPIVSATLFSIRQALGLKVEHSWEETLSSIVHKYTRSLSE